MKRIFRSKLALTLAAFLMIAAAIVIPLSGNILHSHAAAPAVTTPFSSTFTMASCSTPSTIVTVISSLNKGDVVSGTASLTSGDTTENTQGEDLVLTETNGPFTLTITVNSGSKPVNFTAAANSDSLTACIKDGIDGPDSDQTATISGTVTSAATPTPPPTTHRQLIIFLQGIGTDLNGKQANKGEIVGLSTVPSTVKMVFPGASTKPDASTRLLEYSYFGSRTDNGLPVGYNCVDTITNSLHLDALLLDKQIKNAFMVEPANTDVDIYLIAHSLGGAVALTYLDFLVQKLGVSLPPHAHLKAVITLDSPIGGVSKGFLTLYSIVNNIILESKNRCPAANGQPFTSPKDLGTVFDSTAKTTSPDDAGPDPQGARASFLTAFLGRPLPTPISSNEDLVERAQKNLGTSFLSIGNLNDFLWDPHACARIFPSFLDTQFTEDKGDGSGIYGRDFVSGQGTCPGLFNVNKSAQIIYDNHIAVLSDGNAQLGIKKFLTPLVNGNVGGTPGALPINPFQ